jgi:hypothetical protein
MFHLRTQRRASDARGFARVVLEALVMCSSSKTATIFACELREQLLHRCGLFQSRNIPALSVGLLEGLYRRIG